MKKAALLLALCPLAAFPQAAKPVTALIRLHYVQPEVVRDLINPGGYIQVTANNALKAVVLRGSPEGVTQAEKLIQQLDAAPLEASARNVEITAYIVGATSKSAPQAAAVPQNLESVIRQLKAVFPYSTYTLLDSMLIRSREGSSTSTNGMLKDFPAKPAAGDFALYPSTYAIDYALLPRDSSDASGAIRFSKFQFIANETTLMGTAQSHQAQNIHLGFTSNLDISEGQKVVVGKTDIDGGDAALFVVLTARIEPTATR
jgi:hypothetical protein